jgi:multidrug efflux system outer membrane protein
MLDAEAAILDRTIATWREAVRIADERLQAGVTSEFDVTRARAELASNEADSYSIARTRGEVENALATLLGRPASLVRVAHHALPAEASPPSLPTGLPGQLLERRPDVAEAERQLAAANAQVGVAKAAFFPVVRLTGAAGFESADIGLLFNWESRIWQLGPSMTLPIFEGGRNVANLGAARARYDEAVGRYRGQVLVAFQDVENALNDLHQLAGQSEAEGRALASARRSLELARKQYEKGTVTFLDVLDAERTALADERLTAELAGQRLQAAVQLVKALGGGWN